MNELKVFSNPQFGEVRTVTEDGATLFCGADVAKALGYKRPNDAITAHCKGTVKRRTPTKGGKQEMLFIPEGDIYRLAARSELPGADAFERWIFDEVLPTIRLTGGYTVRALAEDLDVSTVSFLGTPLLAARDMDGQIWVGVRWMCEGIGLTDGQTANQVKRIQKSAVLSGGAKCFRLPTSGGPQPVLCLKLDFTPLWLASIKLTPTMKREQPAAATRLVEYQLKMRDAVAAALLDSGKIPIMQALVKMEQRQKAQDYAMQGLAGRLSLLEDPAQLTAVADAIQSAADGLKAAMSEFREAAERGVRREEHRAPPREEPPLWNTRCRGILYRAAKKAHISQDLLEEEARRRAEAHMDAFMTDKERQGAYIREVEKMARWYGV